MIRKKWHYDAGAARDYFRVSDYHEPVMGEWIGRDAERLGLTGTATWEDFEKILDGVNPLTGEALTRNTHEIRRVAFELNFNSVKDSSIAGALAGDRNEGDPLVRWAHKEAVKYTLGLLEQDMQARVRDGGKRDSRDNRTTGGMVAWMTTHGETRVNEDDFTPDPNLHEHVLLFATFDTAANKGSGAWRAVEVNQIVNKLPFYESVYHNRMATLLRTEGGYGIERDGKAYGIVGVSDDLKTMFSRRSETIKRERKKIEEKYGITMTPEAAAELGAKTRLGKTDMTEADLHGVWLDKLAANQRRQLAGLKGQASEGTDAEAAVRFAVEHEFYRHSVVPEAKLFETALRHGVGFVTEEEVRQECRRQGVLFKEGQATTKDVLAEEQRIIDLARRRGTMAPLAPKARLELAAIHSDVELSAEQEAVCRHIWQSCDPVVLIEGDAGTGKTETMKATIPGVDKPGVFLAPSGSASRGTLREKGFANANTIAMFKADPKLREQAKDGYVYVDEAPMAALSDIAFILDWASKNNARVVLQGDRKQHKSPQRGNLFEILDRFAGLPVARLTENFRQLHDGYRQAVDKMARGDIAGGHKMIADLGWVEQVKPADLEKAMADECLKYIEAGESFVAVGITHKQNDAITEELRRELRARGRIGADETPLDALVPMEWTPAQKKDYAAYQGTEVVKFFRNSGSFKAGQRVTVDELKNSVRPVNPENFAVYATRTIGLSTGDVLRTTAGGKSLDGKRIDNGEKLVFQGFNGDGDLVMNRGRSTLVLGRDFRHLAHGLVDTSFKSQSETKARIVGAFTEANLPGINAEQYYVTLSRGRLSAKLFSTLDRGELADRICRRDSRTSATELMQRKKSRTRRARSEEFVRTLRRNYGRLQSRIKESIHRPVVHQLEHRREGLSR